MRTVTAVFAFAFVTAVAFAQPVAPQPPAVGGEAAALPGGKEVSQPLQPVGPEPVVPPVEEPVVLPEAKAVAPERVRGPLGPSWDAMELLYWWPTRQPAPALAFGTRSGLPPLPGMPGTQLLAGGSAIDSQPSAGGRFTLGYSTNCAQTVGLEATYFFLGTRTFRENVRNFGGSPIQTFGVPFVNAATGAGEILTLGEAGESHSFLNVSTSVRVQGWEVHGVANVLDEKSLKLNALMGYRYFMANEGLRIQQTQFRYTGAGGVVQTADQFDAHNRFHGGQLGLQADVRRGIVFCEMTAKIAFGRTYQVVKTEGMTHLISPGAAGPTVQSFGGSGIYVQPSNFGRAADGVFAVLPEGTVKFGFRLSETGRLYVGYSFIYLSDAVRPGDQIDRTLAVAQVPLVSGAPPVPADRPSRLFNRSDFWVQGLVIGLETRY